MEVRDLMVSEVILDQLTQAGARVLTAAGADACQARPTIRRAP
jgi:hypothetical protein